MPEQTLPPYFQHYIDLVPEDEIIEALKGQQDLVINFFSGIDESKTDYAYAPGKWTLKEMLQHIIDCERIFAYRALCIARGEKGSLPGFEENDYAANSNANRRSWKDLCDEFTIVRRSTTILFENFDEDMMAREGTANKRPVSVKTLGFCLVGHLYHHKNIVENRYLLETPL